MSIDTSEANFEAHIEAVLTGTNLTEERPEEKRPGEGSSGAGGATQREVRERARSYGTFAPGGYEKRTAGDYDRERCLLPDDVIGFILATQPQTWQRLKEHYGENARPRFLRRLARAIEKRGTLDVLRRGVKDHGCHFDLVYYRPTTGLNPELREKYRANRFTVMRQLPFSPKTEHTIDLVLFLNGLPLFTAELKNPLKGQNVEDAIEQYRADRDPREDFFQYGRCLVHFAVDTEEVYMTTELEGRDTTFLPFNKGHDGGAGNPPVREGYRTQYLWRRIWSPDSVLDLIQHYIHEIEILDDEGRKTGDKALIFPRYHQLRAVRRLVRHAREHGPGEQYLTQHSAGSGKSISIALLAHQLAFLHDTDDVPVFDTVVVVTDRRVLDRQIAQVIRQFEQTRGVVANVTKGSGELQRALERGKKVVVTTLQKFPYVSDAIREQETTRFAVIIDEAHSSQSGEYRKHLNATLRPESLEAAEDEDATEADLEDKILAEIRKRGPQPNVSNFAFTATPKPKTLEMFGTRQPDGTYEPFDLYSMRQAIDEGFILDVLENYTTYTDYFHLLKRIEDDPQYDQQQATRLLQSHVAGHEHTIRQKVEVIVEHFAERVAHRIRGRAKAMIVTRSRLHAVRYRLVLDRYLDEEGYDYDALVAFSGTVRDPDTGLEYTESGMNRLPETQTAQAFDQPGYRFLVAANKFQTGFDQPKLHTMYVDKKLGGVNAVQTLSRLNRTHPHKQEAMVLDFANEAEDIRAAFQPYYETTTLSERTNPNLLHDLEQELAAYHIYTPSDLDRFAELWFGAEGTQKQLHGLLDDAVERYAEASEDEQQDFRQQLAQYIRLYAFLSQVIPFNDPDLEVLYEFGRHLYGKLPIQRRQVPREILQYVDLDSYRLQRTHTGGVELERGNEPLDAQARSTGGGRESSSEEKAPLSDILELLNERFGYEFDEDDRVFIERWAENINERDAVHDSLRVNASSDARLTFEQVATDELQDMVDANFQLYKKIVEDEAFGALLLDYLFDQIRRKSQNGGERRSGS